MQPSGIHTLPPENGRWRRLGLPLLLVLFIIGIAVLSLTGGIRLGVGGLLGTVTDPQGMPIPDVKVTLIGPGEPRTGSADANGRFEILELDPGNYIIEAQRVGYETTIFEPVHIRMGRSTSINMQMRPVVPPRVKMEILPAEEESVDGQATDSPPESEHEE